MTKNYGVSVARGTNAARDMEDDMERMLAMGFIPLGGVSISTDGGSVTLAQSYVKAAAGPYREWAIQLMRPAPKPAAQATPPKNPKN